MSQPVIEVSEKFINITASQQIKAGFGKLLGIFVASASSTPTIKVWGQTTAAVPVIANTFVPVGGTFYPLPACFSAGLFVTISGTVDCTVFFE